MISTQTFFKCLNKKTFDIRLLANRFRLMRGYRCGMTKGVGFPSVVFVELTNVCNLRCPMCPHTRMRRPQGMMAKELFVDIVSQLAASSVELVMLHGYGESLLHPQFGEFLALAKNAGLTVALSTNGLLLDEEKTRAIVDHKLDILIFSYDAQDPATYASIREGGDLSILESNLGYFLAYKGKRKPYTILQVIQFPHLPSQKESIVSRWKGHDVVVAQRPAHNWLGDNAKISQITYDSGKKSGGVCDQAWRLSFILWDGRVVPCCNFYDAQVCLGSIQEKPFGTIWYDQPYQAFRAQHLSKRREEIPFCQTCSQQAPGMFERTALRVLDQVTVNAYMHSVDGWR